MPDTQPFLRHTPSAAAALRVACDASLGALSLKAAFTTHAPWTILFGASASGKSSLLRLIAGLWMPAGGHVRLGAEDLSGVPAHMRRIGLVAQQPALFPHLSVAGNVRFGLYKETASSLYKELVHLFDLGPLLQAGTAPLSGGERQRVSIARALAASPRLLLLDEVFTGMHRDLRNELLRKVRAHCQQHGIPVLAVTHDVVEALAADEVLRLVRGHVVAQGPPTEVLREERAALLRALQSPTSRR